MAARHQLFCLGQSHYAKSFFHRVQPSRARRDSPYAGSVAPRGDRADARRSPDLQRNDHGDKSLATESTRGRVARGLRGSALERDRRADANFAERRPLPFNAWPQAASRCRGSAAGPTAKPRGARSRYARCWQQLEGPVRSSSSIRIGSRTSSLTFGSFGIFIPSSSFYRPSAGGGHLRLPAGIALGRLPLYLWQTNFALWPSIEVLSTLISFLSAQLYVPSFLYG